MINIVREVKERSLCASPWSPAGQTEQVAARPVTGLYCPPWHESQSLWPLATWENPPKQSRHAEASKFGEYWPDGQLVHPEAPWSERWMF